MNKLKQNKIIKLIKNGDYFANKYGLIFSNKQYKSPAILGQKINNSGYYMVHLVKVPERIDCCAHQFCYLYFHGGYSEDMQINHKDGNKLNNKITNLELVTASENQKHSYAIGKGKDQNGEKNASAKLTKKQVLEIRKKHSQGKTQRKLAKEYGVCFGNINNIVLRKSWKEI